MYSSRHLAFGRKVHVLYNNNNNYMHCPLSRLYRSWLRFGDGFAMETRASAALCSALCASALDGLLTEVASEGELHDAEALMGVSSAG